MFTLNHILLKLMTCVYDGFNELMSKTFPVLNCIFQPLEG